VKTTVELPDELCGPREGAARPSLADLMKEARGVVDSGVPDFASNPKHLAGFGRNARRCRYGGCASRAHGKNGGETPPLRDRQFASILIFAALMIGHHFSISALWWAVSAAGVNRSRGGMA